MSNDFGSEFSPEYDAYLQAAANLDDEAFATWLLKQCQVVSGGCREWRGQRYPSVTRGGVTISATAFLLRGRDLGVDEYACHSCNNPCCINPDHLYVGDAARRPLDNPPAKVKLKEKISIQQAQDIVDLLDGGEFFKAQLARHYGVSITAINKQVDRLEKYLIERGLKRVKPRDDNLANLIRSFNPDDEDF